MLLWKDALHVLWAKSTDFMIEAKIWDSNKQCFWHLFAIYASTDEKKWRDQ